MSGAFQLTGKRALVTGANTGIGQAIALGLAFAVGGKPWGIHAGLYGLPVNVAIAVGGSLLLPGEQPAAAAPG